jgi:hypothetical protein
MIAEPPRGTTSAPSLPWEYATSITAGGGAVDAGWVGGGELDGVAVAVDEVELDGRVVDVEEVDAEEVETDVVDVVGAAVVTTLEGVADAPGAVAGPPATVVDGAPVDATSSFGPVRSATPSPKTTPRTATAATPAPSTARDRLVVGQRLGAPSVGAGTSPAASSSGFAVKGPVVVRTGFRSQSIGAPDGGQR